MNPDEELRKAITFIVKQRQRLAKAGEPPLTQQEMDEYIRVKTGGARTYADAAERLEHKPGTAEDIARSLMQGLTLGGFDELVGLFDEDMGNEVETRDDRFASEHPGVNLMLRGAGGAALPAGLIGRAAKTVPAMMKAGAAAGGATGLVAGALEADGDLDDRSRGAAFGGAGGLVLGAAVPAVIGAATQFSPRVRAARRVADAVDKSGGEYNIMRQLGRFNAASDRDQIAMLGDLSPRLQAEVDFAANNNIDARERLREVLDVRRPRATDRILEDVRDLAGARGAMPEHAATRLDALKEARRAWANGPEGFAGLRERNPVVSADAIARTLQVPEVRTAWRAARLAGDITEENVPASLRSVFMQPKIDGRTIRPASFEDLHAFRSLLDDKASAAFNGKKTNLGPAYAGLRDKVDDLLEANVPGYRQVMADYHHRMDLERALESGRTAWGRVNEDELRLRLRGMSDAERDEFRRGIASAFVDDLQNARTNRSVASQLMSRSAAMDAQLKAVFPTKNAFDEFVKSIAVERQLDLTGAALGNSLTHFRQATAGFDPLEAANALAPGGLTQQVGRSIAARGITGVVNRNTARAVGALTMNPGNDAIQAALSRIGRLRMPVPRSLQVGLSSAMGRVVPSLLDEPDDMM